AFLGLLLTEPGGIRQAGGGVLAGEPDSPDTRVRNHDGSGAVLVEELDVRLRRLGVAIEEVALHLRAVGRHHRHVPAVVERQVYYAGERELRTDGRIPALERALLLHAQAPDSPTALTERGAARRTAGCLTAGRRRWRPPCRGCPSS